MTSGDSIATIEIANWNELPEMPLVSVCMLAYRHEKFIAQAIEGLVAQECNFPIELVIGEDASPDRTGEIARDFQQRHPNLIRILTSSDNVGAHANSLRCQRACRGRFVAFCEGDDYWHHPNKLQMQVNLLCADPKMTLCHTDFDRLTRFRRYRNVHRDVRSPSPATGDAYEDLLLHWTVATATSMYLRSIVMDFMESRFYCQRWPFGDRNLMLYASMRGRVGYVDESTATFRKTLGSVTNDGFESALRFQLALNECIGLFMKYHRVANRDTRVRICSERMKKTYIAAYFSGRTEIMASCFHELEELGKPLSSTAHALQKLAIQLGLPHKMHRTIRQVITKHLSATPST